MPTWTDFEKKMNATLPPQESLILDTLADLHSERIRRGISQRELAKKIGMTQPN